MKIHCSNWLMLAGAASVVATALAEDSTNRLTFSARFGFDTKVRFKNIRTTSSPTNQRTTPNGAPYNYEDGYVYPDSFASEDGRTTYWGYDDSSSQVSGNSILLHNSTQEINSGSRSMRDDPNLGAELVYSRQLFAPSESVRFGFEVAGNYMNISLDGHNSLTATSTRTTDAYPFEPGT